MTSRNRSGSGSITSKTSAPKAWTNFLRKPDRSPDHAGAEVVLDALRRGRHRRAQEAGLELEAMGAVVVPDAGRLNELTRRDRSGMTDDGDQVAMTTRLDAENAEPVLRIMEGHPLDQTGQYLPVGSGGRRWFGPWSHPRPNRCCCHCFQPILTGKRFGMLAGFRAAARGRLRLGKRDGFRLRRCIGDDWLSDTGITLQNLPHRPFIDGAPDRCGRAPAGAGPFSAGSACGLPRRPCHRRRQATASAGHG